MRTLLVLSVLLLSACGSESVSGPAQPPPTASLSPDGDALAAGGGIRRADNDLVIEIDRGTGAAPERYTLTCVGFVEGDHPDAEAACAHLKAMDEPFAPIPDDVMCAQVFAGPETARVEGLWRGEPVDLALSRSDACRTEQWDRLGPLLPPA